MSDSPVWSDQRRDGRVPHFPPGPSGEHRWSRDRTRMNESGTSEEDFISWRERWGEIKAECELIVCVDGRRKRRRKRGRSEGHLCHRKAQFVSHPPGTVIPSADFSSHWLKTDVTNRSPDGKHSRKQRQTGKTTKVDTFRSSGCWRVPDRSRSRWSCCFRNTSWTKQHFAKRKKTLCYKRSCFIFWPTFNADSGKSAVAAPCCWSARSVCTISPVLSSWWKHPEHLLEEHPMEF